MKNGPEWHYRGADRVEWRPSRARGESCTPLVPFTVEDDKCKTWSRRLVIVVHQTTQRQPGERDIPVPAKARPGSESWWMVGMLHSFIHCIGKKTPGGAGTHTGHTRDTRAHKGKRTTQTNLTISIKRHRLLTISVQYTEGCVGELGWLRGLCVCSVCPVCDPVLPVFFNETETVSRSLPHRKRKRFLVSRDACTRTPWMHQAE
jgi:hypothetical protein